MNKASRNVANVNGNPVDLDKVISGLKADLELAQTVAQGNYDVAEQLGGALEIAEGKISVLQARVEELERELALQVEVIAGKETNITDKTLEELSKMTLNSEDIDVDQLIESVENASKVIANSDLNPLEEHIEVFKAVKGAKAKKAKDEEVSV